MNASASMRHLAVILLVSALSACALGINSSEALGAPPVSVPSGLVGTAWTRVRVVVLDTIHRVGRTVRPSLTTALASARHLLRHAWDAGAAGARQFRLAAPGAVASARQGLALGTSLLRRVPTHAASLFAVVAGRFGTVQPEAGTRSTLEATPASCWVADPNSDREPVPRTVAVGPEDTDFSLGSQPSPPTLQPRRLKTEEEIRVEGLITDIFGEFFQDHDIGGRSLTLRVPFGMNNERTRVPGRTQTFFVGGKGTPSELWKEAGSILSSKSFQRYLDDITQPGKKAIVFDLERRSYSVSTDSPLIARLEAGDYPGTPTRLYVLRGDAAADQNDVYDYLYSVGRLGVDCSGLSFYVHESLAGAYGWNVTRQLGKKWRINPDLISRYVGLWFYDPPRGYTTPVDDSIENLRPADVILFRGSGGRLTHSAVIQSIDLDEGLIWYIQSTDWAPKPERGVHLSLIRFDPQRPKADLSHFSVRWIQRVRPAFDGERQPEDWLTDADRYLWYPENGGGLVVRPLFLADLLLEREPLFYTNHLEVTAGGLPDPGETTSSP